MCFCYLQGGDAVRDQTTVGGKITELADDETQRLNKQKNQNKEPRTRRLRSSPRSPGWPRCEGW